MPYLCLYPVQPVQVYDKEIMQVGTPQVCRTFYKYAHPLHGLYKAVHSQLHTLTYPIHNMGQRQLAPLVLRGARILSGVVAVVAKLSPNPHPNPTVADVVQ